MRCVKCGGPYTPYISGEVRAVYCGLCDDYEARNPRCCFCGVKEHAGKDCPRRAEGEPALRKLLNELIPDRDSTKR